MTVHCDTPCPGRQLLVYSNAQYAIYVFIDGVIPVNVSRAQLRFVRPLPCRAPSSGHLATPNGARQTPRGALSAWQLYQSVCRVGPAADQMHAAGHLGEIVSAALLPLPPSPKLRRPHILRNPTGQSCGAGCGWWHRPASGAAAQGKRTDW